TAQTATAAAQNKIQAVYTMIKANPPVTPPGPTPPDPTPPSGSGPFQTLWDATKMPSKTWNQALTITNRAGLDNWLANRKANDHVVCKNFTSTGRLENPRGGRVARACE